MNSYVSATIDALLKMGVLEEGRGQGDNRMFVCPFHKGESFNFGIEINTGQWNCFKCHKRGPGIAPLLQALNITNLGVEPGQFYASIDVREEIERAFRAGYKMITEVETEGVKILELPLSCRLSEFQLAMDYVTGRGFEVSYLESIGVLYSPYGDYGKRVILPWIEKGKIVGFSARAIDDSLKTKILRPRVEYQKHALYNPLGLKEDGRQIILVEGEFDALALTAMGFQARAIFGSYLHFGQIEQLVYASQVLVMGDGDITGREGAERAYKILKGFVRQVGLVRGMPNGEDPASLFQKGEEGRAKLRDLIYMAMELCNK